MQPETLYAPTPDGWRLAMHTWRGRGARRNYPVLMIHGLGANRLNLDLDDRYSLARAAARRGFDVYVLELRGAGLSIAPGGRDRRLFQWGFEDYAHSDVPAAASFVLEHTGASMLHGMGHSMGGMLFYNLGIVRPEVVRSITAVGTPLISRLRLDSRERKLLRLAATFAPEKSQRRVPLKRLMRTAGKFIPLSSRVVDGILLNSQNTDPHVMTRMAHEGLDDVPIQLVLELWRQMAHGDNGYGQSGPYRFESRLHEVMAPVFALSGAVDRIAPPDSVRAGIDRLRSSDVRYRELGRRSGDSADYGHVDLLVGRHAPEEVYPMLLDFVEELD